MKKFSYLSLVIFEHQRQSQHFWKLIMYYIQIRWKYVQCVSSDKVYNEITFFFYFGSKIHFSGGNRTIFFCRNRLIFLLQRKREWNSQLVKIVPNKIKNPNLRVNQCRYENLRIWFCSYRNNTREICKFLKKQANF